MQANTLSPLWCLLFLCIGVSSCPSALWAAPRDELLRLVPDEMTFCVLVQDVRERFKSGSENPFASQLAQTPFARAKLGSPEFKKLLAIQQQVFKDLLLMPEQLRDDLLGDAVVFAYRQGPPDKPEQEQGLFLLWARDQALLLKVIDRINALQKQTGELKELRAHQHNDRSYQQRLRVKNQQTASEFYFVHDHVLVYTKQEALLKAVIDRDRLPAIEKTPPYWSRMLQQLSISKAMVAFLINARRFDADLKAREEAAKGDERAFLKEFRRYWQAFEGLGIFADMAENLELGFAVQVRKDVLPKAAQQFFSQLGKPSALWQAIPDDPLFAVASRMDLAALVEVFSGFCDENRLKEIRKSLDGGLGPFLPAKGQMDALKKGLGPDWGFWALAPAIVEKTWMPQLLWAIQVHETVEGVSAASTIRNGLQFLVTVAQLAAKDELRVETLKHDQLEIKYLVHKTLFPLGFRPAFAFRDGYLLFSSTPEAIRGFTPPGKVNDGATAEVSLLRISASGWRSYMSNHKDGIADFLAKTTGTPMKDIRGQMETAIDNLKAFDRFEIVLLSQTDQATLTLRLKAARK